jgi:hypothetical protein
LFLTPSPSMLTTKDFFELNPYGYSPYVLSCLTRGWICCLRLLLALASAIILGSESRGIHDHILLSQIRNFPNLKYRPSYLYTPRNTVAQLYPQALGFIFVAFYDSQGYSGGIRTHLHMGSVSRLSSQSQSQSRVGPSRNHRFQQFLY